MLNQNSFQKQAEYSQSVLNLWMYWIYMAASVLHTPAVEQQLSGSEQMGSLRFQV